MFHQARNHLLLNGNYSEIVFEGQGNFMVWITAILNCIPSARINE
jgi:hypothetical protein